MQNGYNLSLEFDEEASTVDKLVPKEFTIQEAYGFPSQIKLMGATKGHPLVPKRDPNHVFNKDHIKLFLGVVNDPNPDPIYVVGPTGSGKTSDILQMLGAINMPVIILTGSSSKEPDDIICRVHLRDGNTMLVKSALLQAYEQGIPILIDEMDLLSAEAVAALHRILEHESIMLDDGQICYPAQKNVIFATGNTRGDGQGSDAYLGTNILNIATMGRFETWQFDYPPAEVDIQILKNKYPSLDENIVNCISKTVLDIRTAYHQGSCPAPMSIRDMLRWGKLLIREWHRTDIQPVYYSFDLAFGNRVDSFVRQMLHTLMHTNFGGNIPKEVV